MIHYHGSPLGGDSYEKSRFYKGRHAMVSFANPGDLPTVAECCQTFALDNGAFSLWRKGEMVDVEGYARWVNSWCRHPAFDWALIPDIIDGDELDNDRLIRDWGLPDYYSVPVWHLNESLDKLVKLALEFPRVAFGSSGEYKTPGTGPWHKRMDVAMSAVCERGVPRSRLHGLRMLNPMIFQRYPFSSADSTNAVRNATYDGQFGAYPHPKKWGRAVIIADRIESAQSPAVYDRDKQFELEFALNY